MTLNWIFTCIIVIATVIFGSWWLKGKELPRSHEKRYNSSTVTLSSSNIADKPKIPPPPSLQLCTEPPQLVLVLSAHSVKRSVLNVAPAGMCWQLTAQQLSEVKTILSVFVLDAVVVDVDSFTRETNRELWLMLNHCGQAGYFCHTLSATAATQFFFEPSVAPFIVVVSQSELLSLLTQRRHSQQQHSVRYQPQRQDLLPKLDHDLRDREQKFLHRLWHLLQHAHTDAEFNLEQAAQGMAMSTRQLNRVMKDIFGVTFAKYLQTFRVHKARALLQQGMSVTAVVLETGFSNPSLFSRVYKNRFGYPPSKENA